MVNLPRRAAAGAPDDAGRRTDDGFIERLRRLQEQAQEQVRRLEEAERDSKEAREKLEENRRKLLSL